MEERNINHYQSEYDQLPFEPTMAAIRKEMVLKLLREQKARNILEVGCGNRALFNDYPDFDRLAVVEPSPVFFKRAEEDARSFPDKQILLINDFFSDNLLNSYDLSGIDTLLISGLLHELAQPELMLRDAWNVAGQDTLVHINVPNARSLHRLMAREMGLLQDVKQKTDLQQLLQQHHTFDLESLTALAEGAGFKIISSGSYFIKPFSHKQMDALQQHPLFGSPVIEGFEKIIRYLPDYGAEIYLNLQKQ